MNFLALQQALNNKKKAEKKEATPDAIDALEYFASMEKEHNLFFDKIFNDSSPVLDAAFEMFDMVDIQAASIPLSFSEVADLV
jgi:hypothetical protein